MNYVKWTKFNKFYFNIIELLNVLRNFKGKSWQFTLLVMNSLAVLYLKRWCVVALKGFIYIDTSVLLFFLRQTAPPRAGSGLSQNCFPSCPAKGGQAKNLYTWIGKSDPSVRSGRFNLYNRHITLLPRTTKTYATYFTFMLSCIVIDFFLNNQPDALIIQIYSVIKFYMFRASSSSGFFYCTFGTGKFHAVIFING